MAVYLFISGQEIFIVLVVALILFGAKKLPDIARGIGKGMREFRKATDDIKREFNESTKDVQDDIKDISDSVNKNLKG
jgi:sec-independent protein translocase protein TatA